VLEAQQAQLGCTSPETNSHALTPRSARLARELAERSRKALLLNSGMRVSSTLSEVRLRPVSNRFLAVGLMRVRLRMCGRVFPAQRGRTGAWRVCSRRSTRA
jgi:hypothetical protein